jgi:predicted MPP superfamily phosphohydrolase
MEDLQRKRLAIERGDLTCWARRGRGSFRAHQARLLPALLRTLLRLTGLHARGERNALNPVLREISFADEHLPEAFCGFRLLHLSDIHAGGLAGLAECISERIRQLPVDLCVMTGDYRFGSDRPCHTLYPHMEIILRSVKARWGVVGILGNHDLAEEVPALERMGVTMLVNEALALHRGRERIWLIGLDDPHYYGCDDLPGALRGVPPEAFKILLVHTPELIHEAAASGINLYLCGHTHGGQICMPGLGPVRVNANCPRRYTRGVWRYQHVQGYTSAGVGTSGVAVRFFCPPEIGLIELRCTRHAMTRPLPARLKGRKPSQRPLSQVAGAKT